VVVGRFVAAVGQEGKSPTGQAVALAELSEDPETWPEITKKECLAALVKLVKSSTDEVVQQSACRIMVNLTVEVPNRQALIEAGGFTASLELSLQATNPRVQQGITHIVNQMARPETVISVIECGGMQDIQRLAASDKDEKTVLRTAALFAWRASETAEGRASLVERGVLGLLQQLTASASIVAQFLGYLVAVSLVMEVGCGEEWVQTMVDLRAFVNNVDEDTAQAQVPGAVPLPVDVERVAAMTASQESHAQAIGAWTFSILALDEGSKPRVKQSGATSALASAMMADDDDTRRFAARALIELWDAEGSSAAMQTAQAMELRLAVADQMLKESSYWDGELKNRESNFETQLEHWQPTVDVRGEELCIQLEFLSQLVESSGELASLRSRLLESQKTGRENHTAFIDSTNNSQARTGILAESRTAMLETLVRAKDLSATALEHGGGASEDEDEAVRLLKVKEHLTRQVTESKESHAGLQAQSEGLTVETQSLKEALASLEEAISEGPQRKERLVQSKASLEQEQLSLAEKMQAADAGVATVVEEKARLTIEKKKLAKKEARVTSLSETLSTMQEMEAENRRKAEELAKMDEARHFNAD